MTEEISQETSSNVYIKINISDNVDYAKNTINIDMSYIKSIPKDNPVATICALISQLVEWRLPYVVSTYLPEIGELILSYIEKVCGWILTQKQ